MLCNKLHSIAGGLDNLTLPSDEEKRKAYEAARQLPMSADGKKWRLGEQDFEALMKHLDNVVCCLLHVSMSVCASFSTTAGSAWKDLHNNDNVLVFDCTSFWSVCTFSAVEVEKCIVRDQFSGGGNSVYPA